jgi:hypothetical protein
VLLKAYVPFGTPFAPICRKQYSQLCSCILFGSKVDRRRILRASGVFFCKIGRSALLDIHMTNLEDNKT